VREPANLAEAKPKDAMKPGDSVGPYRIGEKIGEGGMGEVYRARDSRLGRDVAIKALPSILAADPDALGRFEREMKTLAALSHPHIVAIYDVGRDGPTAYAVTELLAGESLADTIAHGPMPLRKAIEYGIQIARALAAAHERGIVHRDLKPANVFVGTDGHVKVLDFGLARSEALAPTGDPTVTGRTTPGTVMGTVGYMAPEQARGRQVDHRADIFSFGCVMYELVSGRRAFQRDTAADTLSALLNDDPTPLSGISAAVPLALERVIQRCVEKNPAERFQSARDLAFALDALSTPTTGTGTRHAVRSRPRRLRQVAVGASALTALALAFLAGRGLAPTPNVPVSLQRLTFERGALRSGRFTPDGDTVVYGAAWGGGPLKAFVTRTENPESRALDVPAGDVSAVSRSGDLALSVGRQYPTSWTGDGTLARGGLFSSSVREVLEHVRDADFLTNDSMVIVRRVNGRDRLEAPQGNVVFETPGYLDHVRVSLDGTRVGFLEHPLYGDNRGHIDVFENGKVRRLTPEYSGLEGLAWTPDGREIWSAGGDTVHWAVIAADASNQTPRPARVVWNVPTDIVVLDIDKRGRVLLSANQVTSELRGAMRGELRDRNLSAGSWSLPGLVSRDGRMLTLTGMNTVDPNYDLMIRKMDGSPAVKVGSGRGQEVSDDGRWVLAVMPSAPRRVLLVPTGAGDSRQIDVGDLEPILATFVPRGLTIAVAGQRAGSPAIAIVDVNSNKRTNIDASMLNGRAFSQRRVSPTYVAPDASLVAIGADDGKVMAWTLEGAGPREIATLAPGEVFGGWAADPSHIYVVGWSSPVAHVYSLDLTTGQRTSVRDIRIEDPAGMLMSMPDLFLSADAGSYVYGFTRMLSTLYLVEGLK
jgi:eukaryotic-like serine/threonine-protein kinase